MIQKFNYVTQLKCRGNFQTNIAITLFVASIATSTIADTNVYEFLSGRNIYNKVKNDAINTNREVFLKYEKQASKKIIFGCIESAVTYSVKAQWNLKITSKFTAEEMAESLCTDSGALGAILLGYKIKNEIRF